jgi:BlaR1 peptidase M56
VKKAGWVAVGLLATLAVACGFWVMGCPAGAACLSMRGAMVWSYPIAVTAFLLLIAAAIGWPVRAVWLLRTSTNEVIRLRRLSLPEPLIAAMARTSAWRLECIEGERPLAFCAGAVHPTVFVTAELIDRLDASELDAVLLHERYHADRREPLRRALIKAATDVFFFIPLLSWWAERRLEESELAADRAAIGQVGRRTMGRALWRAVDQKLQALPAFGGAAEARVAQVLGERLAPRPPSLSLWFASVAGSILMVSIAVCLAHVFIAIS